MAAMSTDVEAPKASVRERALAVFDPLFQAELNKQLPANIKPERLQAAFMTAVLIDRDILQCAPSSIRIALLKCASDGLVPDGRQAALVRFNGQAQYIPMVQGIIARAHELGELFGLNAQCVHENDLFEADLADHTRTKHVPPPMNEPRGEVVGAYVIFYARNGAVLHREIMTRSEIDKARAVSKAKSGPWNHWFTEMVRKTVIRRGAKYIPMSDKLRDIVNRDDELTTIQEAQRATPVNHNPLLPPPEQSPAIEELEPLLKRFTDAVALATTEDELTQLLQAYDSEIAEADKLTQDAARVIANKRSAELRSEAA